VPGQLIGQRVSVRADWAPVKVSLVLADEVDRRDRASAEFRARAAKLDPHHAPARLDNTVGGWRCARAALRIDGRSVYGEGVRRLLRRSA
jgi:hypothetical protein